MQYIGVKRTLYFVKCPKQKRAFYLSIVRSQFEHCVQIWRPTTSTYIDKLERIQRRAVKWILSEPDHHYNDVEYTKRLKDLDLLPLYYRFMFLDLVIFYKIFHNDMCVKLPHYYKHVTDDDRNRLRNVVKPPNYYMKSKTINLENLRKIKNDNLSVKCILEVQKPVLKNIFFFRTTQFWNRVPINIRSAKSLAMFETLLKGHFWELAMEMEPD